MLIWIRESPAFGPAVRKLKLDVTEAYIRLIQGSAIRSVCGQQDINPSRGTVQSCSSGMREMAALALEGGAGTGIFGALTAEAVDAALTVWSSLTCHENHDSQGQLRCMKYETVLGATLVPPNQLLIRSDVQKLGTRPSGSGL